MLRDYSSPGRRRVFPEGDLEKTRRVRAVASVFSFARRAASPRESLAVMDLAAMIFSDELPPLTGSRVMLRHPTALDTPDLFELFRDPDVTRYWSRPPMRDSLEASHYLEEILQGLATRTLFQWCLAEKTTRRLIGTCTLFHCDSRNRRAECGYALASPYWGRGYMTEALTLLFDFAFEQLKLHRLEADVDPRNQASLKLLERLGFEHEGLARERWLLNGETLDACLLGLLASDWRRVRSPAKNIPI